MAFKETRFAQTVRRAVPFVKDFFRRPFGPAAQSVAPAVVPATPLRVVPVAHSRAVLSEPERAIRASGPITDYHRCHSDGHVEYPGSETHPAKEGSYSRINGQPMPFL